MSAAAVGAGRTPLPRIVVAAPGSGHGKTTVATGLMAALRRAGHEVSGHKIGPDYIDPGYHALATGRPGRNLDAHLVGTDLLVPLLLHGSRTPRPADVAVIEGVMGLHDGALGRDGWGSTAHVASLLAAPVLLVVDASAASRTVAAVVHGLASFDTSVRMAGVVLNKVGSHRHRDEIRSALEATGVPVLGVLHRDDEMSVPSRHLGLVPAPERPQAAAALDRLAQRIADGVDLAEVVRVARTAPDLAGPAWQPALGPAPAGDRGAGCAGRPVVAVAGGRAFTFRYAETEEILRAAGLDPVVFDPTADATLPPGTSAVYLGGGFPEVHAGELSGNRGLRADLRAAVAAGVPVAAECAGLLYLSRTLDGAPMVDALPAAAAMTPGLTLGYRTAVAPADTLLGPAGTRTTGHEFHRTTTDPVAGATPAWLVDGRPEGWSLDPAGTGRPTVHASYLHTHWAAPGPLAAGFAAAAHRARPWQPDRPGAARRGTGTCARAGDVAGGAGGAGATVAAGPAGAHGRGSAGQAGVDLDHHGDRDVADGLVDLAVNVQLAEPDPWLADLLRSAVAGLARYPDTADATRALAARHGRDPAEVLPTSGGAEAFWLLARALRPRHAVVVHPQFTEPEAALRAAGHAVHRLVLHPDDDWTLHPGQVPASADLVVVGNPTNPTGRLHSAELLAGLARPGRVVLVDEAFLDAVPGEPGSLTGQRLPGLVVARSLTKTWGIAGLRAGYVVGDRDVVGRLAAQQPPWSVSSPALLAMVATAEPHAVDRARRRAELVPGRRRLLIRGLQDLGLRVVPSQAPFVLVDTREAVSGAPPGTVRDRLREHGFAVRRGETFPGLDADWIRVAVRDEATTTALLAALAAVLTPAAPAGGVPGADRHPLPVGGRS
ncbi:cobyrinate a,c-diamide synthase [Nakamurella endophytica]|uniref:cobyrinate a,c-diamide synthase n=1 Tax=Nakamurella endophytica TaxID=1748367 RepID=UPI001E468CA9|nr:cobyrinate a,c-diamide synthase [Nakamurella endophytica]